MTSKATLIIFALAACATRTGLGLPTQATAALESVPIDATPSPCTTSPNGKSITCTHHTTKLFGRDIHYQAPLTPPPWRAAILFQGSFYSAELTWSGRAGQAHGALYQAQLVRDLLAHGYVVITPETKLDGNSFWDTNVIPFVGDWRGMSPEHELMVALLQRIKNGAFGAIDPREVFAAGISSGGYMTSRVGIEYPGAFAAIAIQSASYATCAGFWCWVPKRLPRHHPPTLLLHGARDQVVPLATMREYSLRLAESAIPAAVVVDPNVGHAWLAQAPHAIVEWFDAH